MTVAFVVIGSTCAKKKKLHGILTKESIFSSFLQKGSEKILWKSLDVDFSLYGDFFAFQEGEKGICCAKGKGVFVKQKHRFTFGFQDNQAFGGDGRDDFGEIEARGCVRALRIKHAGVGYSDLDLRRLAEGLAIVFQNSVHLREVCANRCGKDQNGA
jgi:hypothetical protein